MLIKVCGSIRHDCRLIEIQFLGSSHLVLEEFFLYVDKNCRELCWPIKIKAISFMLCSKNMNFTPSTLEKYVRLPLYNAD